MTRSARSARPTAAVLAALATVAPVTAFADKVIVLKSDGRADPKTRARVDVAIAKLAGAGAGSEQTTAGEITYGDAAAMAGCKPEDAACRDEVIGLLAVDEIVTVTVSPRPGGYDVLVRRSGKNGVARDASALVEASAVDQLDAIAPLFAPAARPLAISTVPTSGQELEPASRPIDPPLLAPVAPASPEGPVGGGPNDLGGGTSRLEIAGMVGGGVLLVVGAVLWGSAASTQTEIDDAPVRTPADLDALRELESRGDAYATAGNVVFIGGALVAGISTVLYLRHRRGGGPSRPASTTAHLGPALLGHGTGIGLSFGGTL